MKSMKLPENLYIQTEYHRFHPGNISISVVYYRLEFLRTPSEQNCGGCFVTCNSVKEIYLFEYFLILLLPYFSSLKGVVLLLFMSVLHIYYSKLWRQTTQEKCKHIC
jgi:hypothetical protein